MASIYHNYQDPCFCPRWIGGGHGLRACHVFTPMDTRYTGISVCFHDVAILSVLSCCFLGGSSFSSRLILQCVVYLKAAGGNSPMRHHVTLTLIPQHVGSMAERFGV